jgi:spore coat protein U domain-containing protein, fimbrial subunit CupE1/2/3/6
MNFAARVALAALLAYPAAAMSAINCQVTVTPFNFGNYVPGSAAPLDVTGRIDVRCTGTEGSFLATLSAGGGGSFAQRRMVSGPNLLRYNFYTNAVRTTIWGDGTGGSSPSGGVKPRPGREDFLLPVYGRVFPQQSVGEGVYRDDVLVTIIF